MTRKNMSYTFSASIWYSEWYFVSLPEEMSLQIRRQYQILEEGWGRLKVTATIGKTQWKTSIWFDSKCKQYLLPIKKEVRNKEKVGIDSHIKVTLSF